MRIRRLEATDASDEEKAACEALTKRGLDEATLASGEALLKELSGPEKVFRAAMAADA